MIPICIHLLHVLSTVSPLQFGGGFKLYKSNRAGELIKIDMPPGGYSVSFLRNESELNRAVAYVVPIQRRLEVAASQGPVVAEEPVIAHDCLISVI